MSEPFITVKEPEWGVPVQRDVDYTRTELDECWPVNESSVVRSLLDKYDALATELAAVRTELIAARGDNDRIINKYQVVKAQLATATKLAENTAAGLAAATKRLTEARQEARDAIIEWDADREAWKARLAEARIVVADDDQWSEHCGARDALEWILSPARAGDAGEKS